MEKLYITRIENGLRGLRMGTKTIENCGVGKYLNKLKLLNDGMHEELLGKYKKQIKNLKTEKNEIT
jgi:hypothetical protein